MIYLELLAEEQAQAAYDRFKSAHILSMKLADIENVPRNPYEGICLEQAKTTARQIVALFDAAWNISANERDENMECERIIMELREVSHD